TLAQRILGTQIGCRKQPVACTEVVSARTRRLPNWAGAPRLLECPGVRRSSPGPRSYSSAEERSVHTGEVTGSNPVRTTAGREPPSNPVGALVRQRAGRTS